MSPCFPAEVSLTLSECSIIWAMKRECFYLNFQEVQVAEALKESADKVAHLRSEVGQV